MREPRNYDALRETEREVMPTPERVFAEAGREVTIPQERPGSREVQAAPEVQAEEPVFMSEEDKIDAARAALRETLDKQFEEGLINRHEHKYAVERFETEGVNQNGSSADRAAALEALDKQSDRAGPDTGIDQAPGKAPKDNELDL